MLADFGRELEPQRNGNNLRDEIWGQINPYKSPASNTCLTKKKLSELVIADPMVENKKMMTKMR